MNLFETFGEIFNPEGRLKSLIKETEINWSIFKGLDPSDSLFTAYDDLIDTELEILNVDFNYIPDWYYDYKNHAEKYYGAMRVKTINFNKYEFSQN